MTPDQRRLATAPRKRAGEAGHVRAQWLAARLALLQALQGFPTLLLGLVPVTPAFLPVDRAIPAVPVLAGAAAVGGVELTTPAAVPAVSFIRVGFLDYPGPMPIGS